MATTYQISLHPFSYPFVQPFKTANEDFSSRSGFFIKLEGNGIVAFSECSPLPSFSKESLNEAQSLVQETLPHLALKVDSEPIDFYEWLHSSIKYESVRFAFSALYEDFLAQKRGSYFGEHVGFSSSRLEIPINAVFGLLPTQELVDKGIQKLKEGYKCIKLKASENSIPSLIHAMQFWIQEYPKTHFRLDANGEWPEERCVQLLNELASTNLPIQYVEQPIYPTTVAQIHTLSTVSPIPIAADEMLTDNVTAQELITKRAVDYLIIKPPLIGSIPQILDLIDKAVEHSIHVVITTLLDSGLNRQIHAQIAAYAQAKQTATYIAHGLSTGSMLYQDICKSSLNKRLTHWDLKPIKKLSSLFLASQLPPSQYVYSANG
jgi:o-succinylbenzoate synthase